MLRIILLALSLLSMSCGIRKLKNLSEVPVGDMFHHMVGEKTASDDIPPKQYDTAIASYLNEFLADAKAHKVAISEESVDMLRQIKYVDVLSTTKDVGVIAACSRYYSYSQTLSGKKLLRWMIIEVLRKESEEYAEGDRRRLQELLYHELFHCLLNKGHLPVDAEGNQIEGIMSPVLNKYNPRLATAESWNELVEEMFSKEYLDLIPDVNMGDE